MKDKDFDDSFGSCSPRRQRENQRGLPRRRRTGFIITPVFVSVSTNQLIKRRRLFFSSYQPWRSHEKVQSADEEGEQMAFLSVQGSSLDWPSTQPLSLRQLQGYQRTFSPAGGKSRLRLQASVEAARTAGCHVAKDVSH